MAQTAAARAVDAFVSAVEARGGKAEVVTKGILTLVTVTAGGRTTTLRVKGTTGDTWQARKSEAAVAKAPVTAWALVDLSDGGAIALVSADDYAAHVSKLFSAWQGKNPGKELSSSTTVAVTADAVAGWEDDWSLLGLDGAAAHKPATKAAPAKKAPAKKAAAKKAPAKKAPAKKAAAKKAPAKKAPAKKAPAKKTPAKKASPAKAATKTAPTSTVAAGKAAPAKTPAKTTSPKTPVRASEAKITPIDAQKKAAEQGKPSAAVTPAKSPKSGAASTASKPEKKPAPKTRKSAEKKPASKSTQKKGLLQRLPVVGRLL